MALSGQGSTGNFAGTYGWDVYVKWSATQNQAGNYSDVTAILYTKGRDSGGNFWANASKANITINGTANSKTLSFSTSGTGEKEVMRATVRVPHNSDGKKSFSISAWFQPNFQYTPTGQWINQQVTSSGSWSLDTIARAGGLTWNSADFPHTFGKDARFTITNKVSSYYYFMQLTVGGETRQVLTGSQSSTPTINIPLDMAKNMPNATRGGAVARLITSTSSTGWGNGSLIGYNDYAIDIEVPSNIGPSISGVSFNDVSGTAGKLGYGATSNYFVKRFSTARAKVAYSTAYGSPVRVFQFYYGTSLLYDNQGDTTDIPLTSLPAGKQTITVKIRDDRLRWASYNFDIYVADYSPPQINLISAKRNTSNGTMATLNRSGTVSSLNFGGKEYNTTSVTTYVKESTEASYPSAARHDSTSIATITIDKLDINKTYTVKTIVKDKLSTTSAEINIATAFNLFHFYHDSSVDGVGIGKTYEKGHGLLDVGGNIEMNGNIVTHGSIYNGNLPSGDTTSIAYWRQSVFPVGLSIWFNTQSASNLPSSWGLLYVTKAGEGSFSVQYNKVSTGEVYRISGNTETISGWKNISNNSIQASTTVGLAYGLQAKLYKIGSTVHFVVEQQQPNFTGTGQEMSMAETLPVGYRPAYNTNIVIGRWIGSQSYEPLLLHFYSNSQTVKYSNGRSGVARFSGSGSWITND